MKLRDYQDYAVNSIFNYFIEYTGNPLVVMPTGTGKSLVIADFCKRAITQYPSTKIMMLTHVKELIEQNYEKLAALWPFAPAGLFSSGLGKKETFYPIIFAGIASIAKVKDFNIFGRIDILLIDEAHLVSPNEETMYRFVINTLKEINPFLKVVGLTATDYRLGHGKLTDGGHIFTDVCVDMSKKDSFNWFIQEGYLVPLIPKKPNMEVDVTGIKKRGGEFIDKDAQAAIDKKELTYQACKELVQLADITNRNHWLIFSTGIEHAQHIMEMLQSFDVSVTMVHSKMGDKERDANIADFKAGKYRAMVNNGILTTGFDYPQIDLIGMLRLTMSASLWVQMLGRGTRPLYEDGFDLSTKEGRIASIAASEKQNCLVLDFAGNTRRLGPINDPVIPKPKGQGGSGDAPVKICDSCMCYNHASVRFCEQCGHEFPRHYKFKNKASMDELIASSDDVSVNEVFDVDRVVYKHHEKAGKVPSLKVTYYCGLRSFTEYICLQHDGYPSKRARDWWRYCSNYEEAPTTIEQAMKELDVLRKPKRIRVLLNKEHPEIVNYEYQ